jgi:FixJ family two-component response regulator
LIVHGEPHAPACLLLDNQLGEKVRGVDVHADLRQRGWEIPTVFITAHWDVRLVVEVMRAGADGFITKPYHPEELVDAVGQALRRSAQSVRISSHAQEARARAATLTSRERDVVTLVASGLLNKEIADRLGIALVTVKVHRGRAMVKLGARNPAELSLIASQAGLVG